MSHLNEVGEAETETTVVRHKIEMGLEVEQRLLQLWLMMLMHDTTMHQHRPALHAH